MYENRFIAQTCARYPQLVGIRAQLKQEAKFTLEVKPKTFSLGGQLPAQTWYYASSSSNGTNIPNTFPTIWNKRPPENGTTGENSRIKTEKDHTIETNIKSCDEGVSGNVILHSLPLQSPSDKLSARSTGSIQSEINPDVEFQFHEERLQSWRDVVERLDEYIKDGEDAYASLLEYNCAIGQEYLAERIVVLKRHHQEATEQCNELNCLHQEADEAENKSSDEYFGSHRLLHSFIVLTKTSDKSKLRTTGSIQREINRESKFHESDNRFLT